MMLQENTVLGYKHQRSLMTSVLSSKTPLRHSDVDFHDVFGGPLLRLSNQITRNNFGKGTKPSTLRRGEDGVSVCNLWLVSVRSLCLVKTVIIGVVTTARTSSMISLGEKTL